MRTKKSLYVIGILTIFVMVGAWAVENQSAPAGVAPTDFNPSQPSDYPVTTDIDLDIIGISNIGEVYMLEGIENSTAIEFSGGKYSPGNTAYPRLLLHGVFHEDMRDWREDIIKGITTRRKIELDLHNKSGRRVLQVTFFEAFPVKFSLPPFSVDNSTRYMERLEFVYTNFEITNS